MKSERLVPFLLAAGLLLAALACGPLPTLVVTATPTPQVACAPLLCPEGQVPFCPGDCPGGCGLICVTPTPSPTEGTPPAPGEVTPAEPTTAAGCTLGARWVADVTVPDNTAVAPGTPFVKTWRVRNSGTCAWEPGTRLVFISGTPMGGPAADVPALAPGAQTDVSVSLTAPSTPGTYRANYQFQAPDGTRFGAVIWVQIVVPGTPTASPAPVCTPPPCPSGGVLMCPTPGACPGGCGVICATPTPYPPPGLAILSFTAEVVQDLPPAGKRIRFSWRTQGATHAGIWSGTQMRFPRYWEATPPGEGTLTVDIESTYYRDPMMTLVAQDAAGHEVQANVVVPWACQYAWFFPTDNRACPAYEASTTWAAEEPFERGRMIWLQEVRTGSTVYQRLILVFYNDGRYEKYADTFVEGVDPESDPTIVPPAGLYQPIRGFGKLWRTNSRVRDGLGWATAPEQGFYTQWQMQIAESIGIPFYVRRMDGRIIRAAGWDTGSGTWEEK
jgi:hypothetical protein